MGIHMCPVKIVILIFFFLVFFPTLHAGENDPWPWVASDADASILLFGDTNIQDRDHPVDAFQYLMSTFLQADFRIGNLEGPLAGTSTDPRMPDIPHKTNWKHSDPAMIKGLVGAHIDAVGVANNVTWPWTALMRSLSVLEANKIRYAGGGENAAAAHAPVVLQKDSTRIGFLAYACTVFPFQHAAGDSVPGIASMRIDTFFKPAPNLDKPGRPPQVVTVPVDSEFVRMIADIEKLKSQVDVVICSYHWGRSNYTELMDYQIKVAHAAIDAGADVIMGHGNHELGAIEVYREKPIFYGLGNLVFDWQKMKNRRDGLLVKVDVTDGTVSRVAVVPLRRDEENNPRLLDPNTGTGAELFNIVRHRSEGLSSLAITGREIVINQKNSPSS